MYASQRDRKRGATHETSRPEPTEEEIRPLEAEMEKLTVDDVLLQTVVTLLNLGAPQGGARRGHEDRPTCRRCS